MILQEVIRQQVLSAIPPNATKIVLVDPPDHPNVGDSAILYGEMTFLSVHFPNAKVNFVDYKSYANGQKYLLERADCILFHGGGNFGDLWKRHQNTRLRIMREFPNKPMLQFPQSIHFKDQNNIAEMAEVISKCADYTLVVRDKNSLAFAEKHFSCKTNLSPDMAFYMPKLTRLKPHLDTFCLLREDKELLVDKTKAIISILDELTLTHKHEDWVIEEAPLKAKLNDLLCRWFKLHPSITPILQPIYEYIRILYMRDNVKRGVKLLSSGKIVVTDRLHAMIMSHLLGITNYTFDSLGSKVASFYKAWLSDASITHLIDDVDDLRETIK
ncbi:MAG: polysaccharide pyruvyl transferase family protein [Paraglaciecola sp.]|uniref:polysaccharide pyruvyl transferase family protein n=1 Tax=Paraglaciecola sp. TaxID=1920173 RepID=UPI0032644EF8